MGRKFNRTIILTPLFIVLISFVQCSPKLYNTGKDFAASGNYEDAIAQFTKLIEENPEYTDAYVARAEAYEEIGNKTEAASDYKRATTFESKDKSIFYNAGRLYYELEQYDEAIPMLSKVTSLDKKHVDAYRLKMEAYVALGQYDDALEESNELLKLEETADNYYRRGFINDKLDNYNQAEADFKKSIQKAPDELKGYVALADVLFKNNKMDESLTNCNKALQVDDKCKEALWIRSKIYREKVDYPSAINDL